MSLQQQYEEFGGIGYETVEQSLAAEDGRCCLPSKLFFRLELKREQGGEKERGGDRERKREREGYHRGSY
eukprot:1391692-Amorphochlora_amoeboformis.AAC.1